MSDGAAQETEEFSIEEWNNQIRREKFDLILPKAIRRNNIDMWIVIDRGRGTEPMMLDLDIGTAYGQGIYIFCDGGGERSRGKIHFCLDLKLKLIKGGVIMVVRRDIPRTIV